MRVCPDPRPVMTLETCRRCPGGAWPCVPSSAVLQSSCTASISRASLGCLASVGTVTRSDPVAAAADRRRRGTPAVAVEGLPSSHDPSLDPVSRLWAHRAAWDDGSLGGPCEDHAAGYPGWAWVPWHAWGPRGRMLSMYGGTSSLVRDTRSTGLRSTPDIVSMYISRADHRSLRALAQ